MVLSSETMQTLVILYICSGYAISLMGFRVVLRRVKGLEWNVSDYLTMVCVVALIARTSMIHVVLIWGTNNVPLFYRVLHIFGAEEIYQRETGSKLLLASRFFYIT